MSVEHSGDYCPHCGQQRLFVRQGVNHLVHAIVTLLLCGLWLPIWIIAACSFNPWRCSVCGNDPESYKEPHPEPKIPVNPTGAVPAAALPDFIGLKKAAADLMLAVRDGCRFIVKTVWPMVRGWVVAVGRKIVDRCRGCISYFKSPF